MKRVIGVRVAATLLTGAALTAQILNSRAHEPNAHVISAIKMSPPGNVVQSVLPPISEPVSIMLSSLALLSWTTILRRHRKPTAASMKDAV